ncbi:hypothetical protein HaLaN_26113, partial [Haematococcus lacustris]
RDVFLTGGADGSLRLYHALKQQALLVLEPANAQLHLIWRLPDGLSTSRKGEAALLRRLAAADDAAEA